MTRPSYLSFTLPDSFVDEYKNKKPPFGFPDGSGTSLGEITFARTYSHKKDDGTKEQWYEVVRRVVEGTYSLQKDYCLANRLPWSGNKALASAKNMYDTFFNIKGTPPGRGLSQMGRELVNEHRLSSSLQNCSAISTNEMTRHDPAKPFVFMLEASSLGIGVGFDVRGADKNFKIYQPSEPPTQFIIPDSREGWAEALRLRINSYLIDGKNKVEFDYSEVRPAGSEIKTFGGTASGPEPLREVLDGISDIFENSESETVTVRHIADIMNMIGKCIVAGGARRSAQLMMGKVEDEGYLDFKNYEANPERMSYGWASNNSVDVAVGDDLSSIIEGISRNGEPGVLWMDTTRKYGRLKDAPDDKDWRVVAYNPCCLVGETLVSTVIGDVRLDSITQPSLVVDPDTGLWKKCSAAWSQGVKEVYTLSTKTGNSITGTHDHRLRSNGSWVNLIDFKPGDVIDVHVPEMQHDEVISVDFAGEAEVFDIFVEDIHMFSANNIVAHNCEQPLESMEMCTLSCVFLNNAESKEDFLNSLKYAYLYAKTVTLLPTQWEATNSIMQRNRRIGVSLGGVADFVDNFGLPTLREWMDEGYTELRRLDKVYSEWLCVRESIKISTVKPDGSVGLLAGTSPGVHWTPGGRYFIRRITLQITDPLVDQFKEAGYKVETSFYSPESAVVVELPIKSDAKRSEVEVSIFEKANLAAELQYYWSDNAVSVTVSFDPETEQDDVGKILHMYEGKLKTVSFLPMGGKYEQMPYEQISESQYHDMVSNLRAVDLSPIYGLEAEDAEGEKFCTTDSCMLPGAVSEKQNETLEEEVV